MKISAVLLWSLLACAVVQAQQVPDRSFDHRSKQPAYAPGEGPVVLLDESHNNFHTLEGRYQAFGRVLSNDGYVVRPGTEPFSSTYLQQARILVMANALDSSGSWTLPTGHALTQEEASAVEQWVREGGSLFLIADHMPFGGATRRLGRAFGFNWINGYAMRDDGAPEVFSRRAGNLTANPITEGRSVDERIDSISTFTGSAFLAPPGATPITLFNNDYSVLLPAQAGQFTDSTAYIDGRYFVNGAMLEHGKGRVVAFGEAAMFTAQRQGAQRAPMGMNQQGAEQNAPFLLNVIRWLDRRL